MKQKLKRFFFTTLPKYLVGIAIPLTVGILSAILTRDSMSIYGEITKPPLAPPAILFPIVWSILYLLMGISSTLVFINREKDIENAERGLKFYIISLILNFIWSPIFFIRESYLLSLIILAFLFVSIVYTILAYRKVSPLAAYLQIPYALWVLFAGYLNFAILILNR